MSNKFRNIQTKILELDTAAKNELDEGLYNMIRDRLITPMSSYLFHLHVAYENGRHEKTRERSVVRNLLKKKRKPKPVQENTNVQ